MKTIKCFAYAVFVLFLGFAISSCKGDDGTDGINGIDGATGPAGADGQDGNANVQTYIYDNPIWNTSGSGMFINMEDILTTKTIDIDVILVYVKHGIYVNAIPGLVWAGSVYRNYSVFFYDSNQSPPESLLIISLELNGNVTPNANLAPIEWVKVIIIDSTNVTNTNGNGKSMTNSKQEIYNELENAGIDINKYDEVCDYFGISAL